MSTTRRVIAVLALAGTMSMLTVGQAQAHTISPAQCRAYATVRALESGKPQLLFAQGCRRLASRHNTAHGTIACLGVRGSSMSRIICASLARRQPAWASNWSLHELLRRESGWGMNAINPSSGACGLFQFLPCRWPIINGVVSATADQQIDAGVRYISFRYRSPEGALAHHNAVGWY